jgi:hypothetical protein
MALFSQIAKEWRAHNRDKWGNIRDYSKSQSGNKIFPKQREK